MFNFIVFFILCFVYRYWCKLLDVLILFLLMVIIMFFDCKFVLEVEENGLIVVMIIFLDVLLVRFSWFCFVVVESWFIFWRFIFIYGCVIFLFFISCLIVGCILLFGRVKLMFFILFFEIFILLILIILLEELIKVLLLFFGLIVVFVWIVFMF